jgi:RNA-binding protein
MALALALTGKQRRYLRALGHGLAPLLQIGKEGVTDAFVAAMKQALGDHELIKVKVGGNAPVDRHDAAAELAELGEAELVQVLGNHVLLYRPDPEDPVIELPGGPKKVKKAAPAKKAATRAAGAGGRPGRGPAGKPPRRTPGARRSPGPRSRPDRD